MVSLSFFDCISLKNAETKWEEDQTRTRMWSGVQVVAKKSILTGAGRAQKSIAWSWNYIWKAMRNHQGVFSNGRDSLYFLKDIFPVEWRMYRHVTCSKETLCNSPGERLKWMKVAVLKDSAWVEIFWGAKHQDLFLHQMWEIREVIKVDIQVYGFEIKWMSMLMRLLENWRVSGVYIRVIRGFMQ